MEYFANIENIKLNGTSELNNKKYWNDNYFQIEINKELYDSINENPDKYIYLDGEIVENPDFTKGQTPEGKGLQNNFLNNLPVGFTMFWGGASAPLKSIFALGQALNRGEFKELYEFAVENGLIVSEADWQNQKLYGLYSDGDGGNTFRVPFFNGYKLIGCDSNRYTLGKAIEPALPNIFGRLGVNENGYRDSEGAIYFTGRSGANNYHNSGVAYSMAANIYLDASRSSSIYKDGITTVQTPDIAQNVIIKYES